MIADATARSGTATVEVEASSTEAPPPPPLADTGFGLAVAVALGAALVAGGLGVRALASRSEPRQELLMTRLCNRRVPRAVLALALLLGVAAVGGVAAAEQQEAIVSTEADEFQEGGRSLSLHPAPLTDDSQLDRLDLRDRQAQRFETRVTETDVLAQRTYEVQATMNNLHRVEGDALQPGAENVIASEHLSLGFASDPLDQVVDSVDLVELDGTLTNTQEITCDAVSSILDGSLTDLLDTDPVCQLLDDVLGLLDLSGDDGVTFGDVAFAPDVVRDLDVSGVAAGALPLVPAHGAGGAFTDPECGAGDATGLDPCTAESPPGTAHQAIIADSPQVSSELEAHLTDVQGLLEEIVDALAVSDQPLLDDGSDTGGTVADFAAAIGEYDDVSDQIAVLEEFTALDLNLGPDDVAVSGRTSSRPDLTVTVPDGADGQYEGSIVVTLLDTSNLD